MRSLTWAVSLIGSLVAPMAWAYETPGSLDAALQTAAPGEIVDLGFSSLPLSTVMNVAPNQLIAGGGTLIFSDDPETATEHGTLYSDTLPVGHHRLYLYHVNGTAMPAKITVVLENLGTELADVAHLQRAYPNPTSNYFHAGREAVQWWFGYHNPTSTLIPSGEARLLDLFIDSRSVSPGELAHIIWDIGTDQPLRVTSMILSAEADTLAVFDSLTPAPSDGFDRQGTFEDFAFENTDPCDWDTTDGIRRLSIANQFIPSANPPLTGADAEEGGDATLRGNFGVVYTARVDISSSDGRSVALLLNPRGGAYGGFFRTAFPEGSEPVNQMVPSDSLNVPLNTQGGVIGLFSPSPTPQTLVIEFIPAGASSMPIDLLLVPFTTPPSGEMGVALH